MTKKPFIFILFFLIMPAVFYGANEKRLTGKVTTQATKEPLPGAVVIVKGTKTSTVTNPDGCYTLTLPESITKAVIVVSYIGMETGEATYDGSVKTLDFALSELTQSIDEVVVTGYANVRKESYTGNTTAIKKEDIAKVSPGNILQSIQVFDPSFRLQENIALGSDPNALPNISLRGQTALDMPLFSDGADLSRQNLVGNNNLPIFILDGFEVKVERIYDLDLNRIHKFTILKDAAATSLYGSRAANGVIVIETRAPQTGKLRVAYNLTCKLETPDLSSYNLMNSAEKLQAEIDAGEFLNATKDGYNWEKYMNYYLPRLSDVNRGVNVDWTRIGVRPSLGSRHSLFVDGGEKNIRWGAELRYNKGNGVLKGSYRDTYGSSMSIDYRNGGFQLTNTVDFSVMAGGDSPYEYGEYSHRQPYAELRDPATGKWVQVFPYHVAARSNDRVNPLYESEYLKSYSSNGYKTLNDKLGINYFINSAFTMKAWVTVETTTRESKRFIDPESRQFYGLQADRRGSLEITNQESLAYDANLMILFNKNLNGHIISSTLSGSLHQSDMSSLRSEYRGFANGSNSSINSAAQLPVKPSRSSDKRRLASALGFVNYSYHDLYLADISFRLDGSSQFFNEKRFAPFWAAGAGINLHKYHFIKEAGFISTLKLRGSFGQLGKVTFPPFAAISTYASTSIDSWYYTGIGSILRYLGNDRLTWEKTNVTDISLEAGLWKNKVLLKSTTYNKNTTDMITSITIPASSGFTTYMDNLGRVNNRGIEFELRANVLQMKDLNLSLFGTFAHNKNKIVQISEALKTYNELVNKQYDSYNEYPGDARYAALHTKFVEGGSTTSIFAMKSLGINPANGKEVYERPGGSITYDWKASDMQIVGNTEPTAQGSLGFNATWKRLSIFTSFLYRWGGDQYNSTMVKYVENVSLMNTNADKRVGSQRWKKPGDIAPLKDIADQWLVTRPTSRFVQRDNTLEFNSISLSYDVSSKALNRMGMSMVRLTAGMEKVAFWSTIHRERGLDYPYSKTANFSVNITF
ncbi:MAG: SusC/RagA family TonB-linked outer membrane protein [Dysgonamonadaceae bacterium]|jgi:TonB-linked SusC/RagA family outer membrane protein|nr:SusC/RagA family TonB-linked outer membrane protein [Dysgonamonadaceae bacterium]